MPKQRGFQPGGMVNPMSMSRKLIPSGPSLMEKLQRQTRPSWEDLRSLVKKKESSSAEFLMKWEQDHFHEQLKSHRDEKRTAQEKEHLRELKKEAKRKEKIQKQGNDPEGTSEEEEETKRKRRKTKKRRRKRDDSSDSSETDEDKKKSSKKSKKQKIAHNPHRLSAFFDKIKS
eukprot:GHVS01069550.1.p1 GENE.GHVS01069550.1~~GHVS01069550.1.p1  ORF type:complete len:173 (-),score=38.20 GHVS01069550.1:592-1110(-)